MALKFPFDIVSTSTAPEALTGTYNAAAPGVLKDRVVYIDSSGDVGVASNGITAGYPSVVGVALTGAVTGSPAVVVLHGEMDLDTPIAGTPTPGADVFFDASGVLTTAHPADSLPEDVGNYTQRVGYVKTSTRLYVKIAEPYKF